MKHNETMGYEIRTLDNLMMRNMAACVKRSGLDEITVMHGWIIGYLYDNRGRAVYQKDVEMEFFIGRSTVTNILKLMEKKGYIKREAVSLDARLKRVELTEKGRRLHEDMLPLVERLERSLTEGITEEEKESFYQVVQKLRGNLEKQRGELLC